MGLYNGEGALNRVKALLALTLLCQKTKPKGLFYCGTLIGFCCCFALTPALLKGRIIRACLLQRSVGLGCHRIVSSANNPIGVSLLAGQG